MPGAPMDAEEVVAWLKRKGARRTVDGMARYGIPSARAFGVPMGTLKILAKRLGRDHALARDLWDSGWYEARMLAALVDDPAQVTLGQIKAWTAGFDSWAICDTVCFCLFDRSPLAWKPIKAWASAKPEFVKRTSFVLMACLALHDKTAADKAFLPFLPLIEKGAEDGRNFVMKAVSWALRAIGGRSPALHAAALASAKRLAASERAAARWVGKDAVRDLHSAATRKRLERKPKGPVPGK